MPRNAFIFQRDIIVLQRKSYNNTKDNPQYFIFITEFKMCFFVYKFLGG